MQRMREAFEDGRFAIGREMKKVPKDVDMDDRHVVAAALAFGMRFPVDFFLRLCKIRI